MCWFHGIDAADRRLWWVSAKPIDSVPSGTCNNDDAAIVADAG
jgi:hypothetical protein